MLNLKNIHYEFVPISSLSSVVYRRINPQGLMPALDIDGCFIAQSMAIIEMLEEQFPEPSIFPANVVDRADVRAFAYLITSDLHPINNNRIRRYLRDAVGVNQGQVSGWYQHWMAEASQI